MKARRIMAAVACLALLAGVCACGSSNDGGTSKSTTSSQSSKPKAAPKKKTEEKKVEKPADLTGSWKQTNAASQDQWMEATITADSIEVDWMQKDQKSLYWKGSYVAPTAPGDTYKWTSQGDTATMSNSLLASQDATKDFTYTKGELTYEQSAMGTTSTIRMSKQ